MKLTEQGVLAKLREGWRIAYAPLSGEVILTRLKKKEVLGIPKSIFLDLQYSNRISKIKTHNSTHPILRGTVDIYEET